LSKDPTIAVVVSTWSGNPVSYLFALCRSMDRYPAGLPYDLVLSANGLEYRPPPALASRFRTVFVRENVGYNLGAWDYAWRQLSNYDRFLFLQDECQVIRPGWLARFQQRFESVSNCALVGEYLPRFYDRPWSQLDDQGRMAVGTPNEVERITALRGYRNQLALWGIPEGPTPRAVTSVVQFTSRAILELVDGYNIGQTKGEAIAAEIGFSRKIEARGFVLVQMGRYRHSVISHPQWPSNHPIARLKRSILKRLPWV
jgi:hypothetical protein